VATIIAIAAARRMAVFMLALLLDNSKRIAGPAFRKRGKCELQVPSTVDSVLAGRSSKGTLAQAVSIQAEPGNTWNRSR
jgi:hypothetical protein